MNGHNHKYLDLRIKLAEDCKHINHPTVQRFHSQMSSQFQAQRGNASTLIQNTEFGMTILYFHEDSWRQYPHL